MVVRKLSDLSRFSFLFVLSFWPDQCKSWLHEMIARRIPDINRLSSLFVLSSYSSVSCIIQFAVPIVGAPSPFVFLLIMQLHSLALVWLDLQEVQPRWRSRQLAGTEAERHHRGHRKDRAALRRGGRERLLPRPRRQQQHGDGRVLGPSDGGEREASDSVTGGALLSVGCQGAVGHVVG